VCSGLRYKGKDDCLKKQPGHNQPEANVKGDVKIKVCGMIAPVAIMEAVKGKVVTG